MNGGDELLAVLFAAMVALVLLSVYLRQKVYTYLEQEHHGTWSRLGRPSLFVLRGPREATGPHLYFWKGEHRVLNDPTLDRLVLAMKRVEGSLYILFVMALVVYLLVINS